MKPADNDERVALAVTEHATLSFATQVDTGAALLSCFGAALSGLMIAAGIVDAVLGAVLVYFGVSNSSLPCAFPLARWALTYGATSVCVGATGIVSGVLILLLPLVPVSCVVNIASAALSVVTFGMLVWGSVLAFSDDRWHAILNYDAPELPAAVGGSPCAIELYRPVAAIIVVSWVLFGAFNLKPEPRLQVHCHWQWQAPTRTRSRSHGPPGSGGDDCAQ